MKKNKVIKTTVMVAQSVRRVTIITLGLILMTVLLFSCGPALKVSSDYDRSVDFSTYKTFSMYDLNAKGNINQLNKDRIVRYIKSEMAKKGYMESNNNPDLMINAVTVIKDKRSLTANTSYYGFGGIYRPYGYWRAPSSTTISSYDYKDGSLVIDIVDPKTKKMIWEGSGNSQFAKKPQNPEAVIGEVVAKILEEFPSMAINK